MGFETVYVGFETVCPEKDKQTAFYSPLCKTLKISIFVKKTLKYATFCREMLRYGTFCRECRNNLNIRAMRK